MIIDLNKITILGTVCDFARQLKTSSENLVVAFSVATRRKFMSLDRKYCDEVETHRVMCAGEEMTSFALDELWGVRTVYIEGRIKSINLQDDDGVARSEKIIEPHRILVLPIEECLYGADFAVGAEENLGRYLRSGDVIHDH